MAKSKAKQITDEEAIDLLSHVADTAVELATEAFKAGRIAETPTDQLRLALAFIDKQVNKNKGKGD